jgi:RNA polymerase-binding transcription factor DksA
MNTTQMKSFREQLLRMSSRLRGDVFDLSEEACHRTGDGNLSNVPLHPADLGTDAFEQQVSFALLESEGQTLAETAEALERIDQDTFGQCEECQMDIPTARLEALPYTRYCIDCARTLERRFN